MLHIRFTPNANPMSDWGHAMFADLEQNHRVAGYGVYAYTFESEQEGVEYIEALNDKIIEARNKTAELLTEYDRLSDDEFCNVFNPPRYRRWRGRVG